MRPAILQTPEFGNILLRVAQWEGKLYLECRDPNGFLRHITKGNLAAELPSSSWVRGVITPGSEAIFEVFDQFGSVGEITSVPEEDIAAQILDLMIWQV